MTQQNAAMVEESTAASHSLSQETSQLTDLIAQFQLAQSARDDTMRRELKKAAPHAFRSAGRAAPGPARAGARIVVDNHRADAADMPSRQHAAMVVNGGPAEADAGWETF